MASVGLIAAVSRWRIIAWALVAWACWPASSALADTLQVDITGVSGRLHRQLVEHLVALQGAQRTTISSSRILAMHRLAPASLSEALEALGYYTASVKPTLVQQGRAWVATYAIVRGPPVRVSTVEIDLLGDAQTDPAWADRVARFPLAVGEVLVHASYEDGKQALEQRLADRGYFDARFTHAEVRVERRTQQARIRLIIDSGRRYRFGELRWPATVLTPGFLGRYVTFSPGDFYRSGDLLDLQTRLVDSNYFSSVVVEPLRDLAQAEQVPVGVELIPRKAHQYSLGLGLGTDTGPRGRASWQRPTVNSQGHQAEADLRVSALYSSLLGLYTIPLRSAYTDSVAFSAKMDTEDTGVAQSHKIQFGVAHLTRRYGWHETVGLAYAVEGYEVADSSAVAGLLIPSARWVRVWSDDPLYTKDGVRLALGLRGAAAQLLSRVSFVQFRGEAKYVHAFGGARLILRSEVGALATGDFDHLPVSERFFAGGDSSVRGFRFESLGPRNAAGKVTGGHYLMTGGVEVEQHLYGSWSGAVFSDFGNALDSFSDPLQYSAGFGVRWLSPVGLVRLDLANGLSDPDHPWRVSVSAGPDL